MVEFLVQIKRNRCAFAGTVPLLGIRVLLNFFERRGAIFCLCLIYGRFVNKVKLFEALKAKQRFEWDSEDKVKVLVVDDKPVGWLSFGDLVHVVDPQPSWDFDAGEHWLCINSEAYHQNCWILSKIHLNGIDCVNVIDTTKLKKHTGPIPDSGKGLGVISFFTSALVVSPQGGIPKAVVISKSQNLPIGPPAVPQGGGGGGVTFFKRCPGLIFSRF